MAFKDSLVDGHEDRAGQTAMRWLKQHGDSLVRLLCVKKLKGKDGEVKCFCLQENQTYLYGHEHATTCNTQTHIILVSSQVVAELDAVAVGELHAVLVECKTRITSKSMDNLVAEKKKLE